MTVTAPTVAAWKGSPDPGWTSSGQTVSHHGVPMLSAVTNEAAHALGVALGGPIGDTCPTSTFNAKGLAVYAGADLLAHAVTGEDAHAAVAALNAHPAAAVLGAGVAVAADPMAGAFRCDPTWLVANDARPWPDRVEEALAHVGCQARVRGSEADARIDCRYRGVELNVRWHAGTAVLRVQGVERPIAVVTTNGPIAGVSHGLEIIDALPEAVLLEIALAAPDGVAEA